MPNLSPQARLLLGGSAMILGLLVVWWFLLPAPMMQVLRTGAGVFLQVQETPTGDWTFRVPLERTLPPTPQQPMGLQIHSIEFDISHTDLITFTFSLPVYWAIILVAPDLRRNLRTLVVGTALMAAAELAMLFVFAQISARNAVSQLGAADDAVSRWARRVGEYLIISVLPFLTPFILALSLHSRLRDEILPSAGKQEKPEARQCGGHPSIRRPKKRNFWSHPYGFLKC